MQKRITQLLKKILNTKATYSTTYNTLCKLALYANDCFNTSVAVIWLLKKCL